MQQNAPQNHQDNLEIQPDLNEFHPNDNGEIQLLRNRIQFNNDNTNQVSGCKKLAQLAYFFYIFILILTKNNVTIFSSIWISWYLTIGIRRYHKQDCCKLIAQFINVIMFFAANIMVLSSQKAMNQNGQIFYFILINVQLYCTASTFIIGFLILLCIGVKLLFSYISARKLKKQLMLRKQQFFTTFLRQQTSQQNIKNKDDDVCTICLLEKPRTPLTCGHWFHMQCIRQWLDNHNTCPVCRIDVY